MENNYEIKNRTPYVLGIMLALIAVTVITASTYAYFTSEVTGTSKNTVVTTGEMAIEFTDGPEVKLEDAIPGTYVEKTFTVKNIGTLNVNYDVFLSSLLNDFVDKTDLTYTLSSVDGGANVSSTQMPSTSSKIVSSNLLEVNETHTYTLRIDFKETNDNQDDNIGKNFSSVVSINQLL